MRIQTRQKGELMSLAESDAQVIAFRDQLQKQRGITDPSNSYENKKKSKRERLENGLLLYTDLPYESKYPNAFFDIWYTEEPTEQKPTILYFHGGGCLFGDKMEGDPLAKGEASESITRKALVQKGYNIVSANYAFAPEYRFPVQLIQVNELVTHLKKHAKELGLSMEDVIVMGSSAGADLTEIYGLIVSNPAYAKRIGIQPAITPANIRGLVIDEAALDMKRLKPGIGTMAESWLGTDDLVHSEAARLASAADHVTRDYPRAFINTSNQMDCFIESAEELKKSLDALGVENVLFYRPAAEVELHHGFLSGLEINQTAKECFDEIIAFLG